MIVDFRRNPLALPPLTIMNSTVSWILQWIHSDYWAPQFLWTWSGTTTDFMVKKAQQRLYFLRQLRKFNLPQELLIHFYSAIIESVLCTSITIWFSSTTKSDLRRQRRVVRTAKRIIGTILPTLQELYISRMSKRAGKITHITSSTLPLQTVTVWSTLQSSRTTRHRNSFFPQAIHLMNTWHQTWNTQHFYTIIYSPHTYFFLHTYTPFIQICTCQTSHIIVCIVYLPFCTLPICIMFFCHLCPVTVILSHCGASVTVTNFLYV